MTREEINAMPAGNALDAAVHLMLGKAVNWKSGWAFTDEVGLLGLTVVPKYSTDLTAAWDAVMDWRNPRKPGGYGELEIRCEGPPDTGLWVVYFGMVATGKANTLPLAICRAALLATIGGAP